MIRPRDKMIRRGMRMKNHLSSKPYPAYKDSGVEWLGKVPEHWAVGAVKSGYDIKLGKMLQTKLISADDIEVPYLKARDVQWFSVQLASTVRMWASPRDIEQFSISSGDLLVCEGGEGGRCGILTGEVNGHIIQNSLHRVRSRYENSNTFLQYIMRAVAETGWFAALNNKATIAHFTYEKFGALRIPLPPLPEQHAIARFLDHANQRIQRHIQAKEKLIKLLEEQKQVIIHQAVTGQIDVRTGQPYPAYKESGVEWLGKVPEHWDVQRSKRVFRPRTELARPDDTQLSATQAYGVIAQADYEKRIGRKVTRILRNLDQRRHVEVDDFVISMRSFQGGLERAWRSGCIRSSYIVLQSAKALIVGYFGYLFKSASYITALQSTANFIRDGQDLNFENFCQVDLPFPPIEEQQKIVQRVDQKTTHIALSIERMRQQISLLHEYRTRLIADVVTGKLDVREAAAKLPKHEPSTTDNTCQDGMALAAQVRSCHP